MSAAIDFYPGKCEDWQTFEFDLEQYLGSEVSFKFEATISSFQGQNLFLDNIFVDRGGACPDQNEIGSGFELAIAIDQEVVSICQGEQFVMSYQFEGPTLQWFLDGERLTGFDPDVSLESPGQYIARVNDRFGCFFTDTLELSITPTPIFQTVSDTLLCEGDSIVLAGNPEASSFRWFKDGNVLADETGSTLTATGSGTYTLINSTDEGCAYSDTSLISFREIPELTVNGNNVICPGSTAEIFVTTNVTDIQWSIEGVPFEPEDPVHLSLTTPGKYEVIATNEFGCFNFEEVPVLSADNIDLSLPADTSLCFGESIQATINQLGDDATVSWFRDDILIAESSLSENLNRSGTYRVLVTNASGCDFSDEFSLIIEDKIELDVELSSPGGLYCADDTVQLQALTNSPMLSWNLNGTDLSNELVISAIESGLYTLSVSQASGCQQDTSVLIQYIPLPEADLGEDQVLCQGSEVMIGDEDIPSYTYSWARNDSILFNENNHTINVSSPGTYSIQVTDTLGCTNSDEVDLDFIPGPTIDIPENVVICPGSNAMIVPISDAIELSWSFQDLPYPSELDGSVTISAPGTYDVIGQGPLGCTVIRSVDVQEAPNPIVLIEDSYALCDAASIEIFAGSEDQNYEWLDDEGNLLSTASSSYTVGMPGQYLLRASTDQGCTLEKEFEVEVRPSPSLELNPQFTVCSGEEAVLQIDNPQNYEIEWFFDGMSIGDSSMISTSDIGNYELLVTSEFGCTASYSTELIPLSLPDILLDETYIICPGDALSLNAGMHESVLWNIGSDSPTVEINSPNPERDSTFLLTVEATDQNGCRSTETTTISFLASLSGEILPGDFSICPGEDIELSIVGGTSFEWLTISEDERTTVQNPTETTMFEALIFNQCEPEGLELSTLITVIGDGNFNISQDTCVITGTTLSLVVEGASSVQWNDHPSIQSGLDRNEISIVADSDHSYKATVFDSLGCSYSLSIDVCIISVTDLIDAPNVITPNIQDGQNDALIFDGLTPSQGAHLTIMNRWSKVVYEHPSYQSDSNLFTGLDNNGEILPSGTYFYILRVAGIPDPIKNSLTIFTSR